MIDDLKFVQGAVAKKDIIPTLTHFRIKDRRILSYNGVIALSSPIELGIDCQPKADDFVKAIQTCQDVVQLSLTPAGRLTVKSGKFKVHVGCINTDFPEIEPNGEFIELTEGGMLPALKMLEPMIAEDASRPWARSILFRDQFAHATNNVVICQYWLGYEYPFDMAIPHGAVNELLRIGIEPTSMQVSEHSVTFHFPGDRWMRTQTASTEWPDIERPLDKEDVNAQDLPPDFFDNLEILRPFVDDFQRCLFIPGAMATHELEGLGARVEHDLIGNTIFPTAACYNINMLRMLAKLATSMDFNHKPALFFGDNLRGAIMEMRFV